MTASTLPTGLWLSERTIRKESGVSRDESTIPGSISHSHSGLTKV